MTPRVAGAPVSFGVIEITVDEELPDPEQLLDHLADTGYAGTELGPPGYLGDGSRVADALGERGLALVGSFLPLRFSRRDEARQDLEELRRTLALLDASTPDDGVRPRALLSDAFVEPDRIALCGRIEEHPEAWLGDQRFRLLVDNAQRAAELCLDAGFEPAFHPHVGGYVETPREVDRFFGAVDTALLPLCYDTGHCLFGGGDPIALLRDLGEIVRHVHLKDVDTDVLGEVRTRGLGLRAAWDRGAFCRLGTGGVDVPAVLDGLRERGYEGWLVVEQDRTLKARHDLQAAFEDSEANRAYLREHGL